VRFEWDEAKNRQNRRKHAVDFEVAALVFDDPNQRSEQDRFVNGEERWQTIGWVSEFYWSVTRGLRKRSFGSSRLERRAARKGVVIIMAIVRYERKPGEPLTRRQKENLKKVARIKDEDIDFSDIPELTDEWFARAVRGKFYRPVKEIVSIRLDKDVLAFYRSQGAGYQTRINDTLRAAMQAAVPSRRKARQ
jgi:uncharacterized protein (DUF4415 family)/uncharacterized DUF497 family protein